MQLEMAWTILAAIALQQLWAACFHHPEDDVLCNLAVDGIPSNPLGMESLDNLLLNLRHRQLRHRQNQAMQVSRGTLISCIQAG